MGQTFDEFLAEQMKDPEFREEFTRLMEEAKRISRDQNVKGYDSVEELNIALEEEDGEEE